MFKQLLLLQLTRLALIKSCRTKILMIRYCKVVNKTKEECRILEACKNSKQLTVVFKQLSLFQLSWSALIKSCKANILVVRDRSTVNKTK